MLSDFKHYLRLLFKGGAGGLAPPQFFGFCFFHTPFRPAAILALAAFLPLLGPQPPAAAAPGESYAGPVFARGAILLPEAAAGAGARNFRVNKKAVPASAMPGGGWWLEAGWSPGETVRVAWEEGLRTLGGEYHAPLRPTPWVWRRLPWRIAPGGLPAEAGGVTALAFSPDGALLAVGGGGGQMAVFQVESGETLWKHRRVGRVIKHLAFSADGQRLFVGEQGPEGRLAAYLPRSGSTRPLWVFDSADELGPATRAAPEDPYGWVRQPGAYRLLAADGDVIAAYSHSRMGADGPAALARLYRLRGADGRRRWAYPAAAPLPGIITWFAASEGAARLVLPLQLPTGADTAVSGGGAGEVVVVDGSSGRPRFSRKIQPVAPYAITAFWRGVALNPAGDRLAAATQDGRGFLFARDRDEIIAAAGGAAGSGGAGWRTVARLQLVKPIELAGTTVTATNGTLAATAHEALFITGPSFIPLAFRSNDGRPAANHPRGNTVFAYGWDGKLRWIRRLENDLQGLAVGGQTETPALGGRQKTPALAGEPRAAANDGALLVLAQGKVLPQQAGEFNGITALRLGGDGRRRGELIFRFALEGRAVYGGVAVSRDGRWIAIAEAPRALKDDPRPRGGHGVILLR